MLVLTLGLALGCRAGGGVAEYWTGIWLLICEIVPGPKGESVCPPGGSGRGSGWLQGGPARSRGGTA